MLLKYLYKPATLLLLGLALGTACDIDEVVDPNNPSLESVTNNASRAELQVLVTGLEARHREYYDNAVELFGTFGREVYPYFGSDPRFTNEWLALEITTTYPDFFASAGTFVSPYLAVKQANILLLAAQNSQAISETERNGYTGLARTIKGFQLLWPLMQQYQNGIRIDVENPLNPGEILSYSEALGEIRAILDEGAEDLAAAGTEFDFDLTSGFAGFDSPAGMLEVNRAIAARAALYAEDFDATLNALDDSFLNLAAGSEAALYTGVYHTWGNAPDVGNPLFYPYDRETNTILIVHPALIEDALPGDERLDKFIKREQFPVINANIGIPQQNNTREPIPGEYQDARYNSVTDPTPWLRNEELILIYAEAQVRKAAPDFAAAVNAINTIRNVWGLADYSGALTEDALIDEILFQRRYSLWAEGGHRWIDLRRLDRLNESYVDLREKGRLFTQIARRTSETNWENR